MNYTPEQESYLLLTHHLLQAILGDAERTLDISIKSDKTVITIDIPDEFRGLLIGKEGRTVSSLRSALEIANLGERIPTFVNILD